jgi:hypothetical protein
MCDALTTTYALLNVTDKVGAVYLCAAATGM